MLFNDTQQMVTCFFWMLQDAMDCADEYFKFLCKYILENRHEDMKFISKRVDKTITTRLEATASSSLLRFSYTEVISLLQKVKHSQIPYSFYLLTVLLHHNDLII